MGNLQGRAVKAVETITPPLLGEFMFEVLRESIMLEPAFQIMFGGGTDKKDPEQSHIFLNNLPSYNESVLPAWEFRFSTEKFEGDDLEVKGHANSRILFPNNLQGDLSFHRKVVLAIVRFFNSAERLNDFLRKVSGLTEFGENLDVRYDLIFVHGGKRLPVITMGIDYIFDMRRFKNENPATDLNARLDADFLRDVTNRLRVLGDESTEEKISDAGSGKSGNGEPRETLLDESTTC